MKFELDNFQKQAIKSLLDGLNVLVTAPTGSGKTLIAEKGIEKYIEDGKKVIYTTPIKALSNQKFNDFQNEGIDTGLLTGDRNENPNANLIIATTEILRNMIFSEDERINEIGLVILDEVHYLADKERGATWEEIIIHLPKKIKILGLSATIGNENEFLSWIVSQRGPTDLIKSNIRPVPLEISLVTATQNDDQITTIKSTKDKKNKRIFQFDKKYRKFKKPTLSNQLEFISLKNSTPSIFFFFSRDKVESKARHASNLIGKTTDNHDLKVLFDSVFGDLTIEEFNLLNLDELFWMWSRRIGFHHAGLAPIVKEFVEHLFIANTHNYMLFFTDTGKCYWLKVYDIPQAGRASRGRAIVNLIGCNPEERVEAFVSVKEFDDDHYIVMATRNGVIKKTVLSAYGKPRKGGIYAIEIRDGDKLIQARVSNGENDILLGTHEGKSIRFSESDVRASGRKTMGVKGIKLSSKDDYVVGMLIVKREGTILVATEKGYGKRTEVLQYRTQTRAGKGVLTMRCTDKTGKMVNIMEVVDSDDLIVITDSGVLMRQPVEAIRSIGRVTQGVRLVKLDKGTNISSITRVISEETATQKQDNNQISIETGEDEPTPDPN